MRLSAVGVSGLFEFRLLFYQLFLNSLGEWFISGLMTTIHIICWPTYTVLDDLSQMQSQAKNIKKTMKITVQVGFAMVIILMSVLATLAIYQTRTATSVVENLVEITNAKIEYANTMRDAILHRRLALISIMGMKDHFERDEEIIRFYSYAEPYRVAREKLLALPTSEEEQDIHTRLTNLTRIAQPLNHDVVDLIRQTEDEVLVFDALHRAQDAQSDLLNLLSSLVALQKQYGETAVKNSRQLFDDGLLIVSIIIALVLITSLLIAYYVTRYVAENNRLLLHKNEQLEREYTRAEEATRSKSEFLANMSHEIRTPLTAIIGFAETSLFSNQSMEARHHALLSIRDSGRHLLQVINDILDLSKIEANKMEIENIAVSPFALLQDIENISQPIAKARGLSFGINYIFPLSSLICTDPLRCKQIILNLCSNALKFTEQGHVYINVSQNTHEHTITFEVVDTGIGLTEEQKSIIFQPFQQADASTNRKFGGTGLGLSLSSDLAKALGGRLSVESEYGRGSRFSLTLDHGDCAKALLIHSMDEIAPRSEEPTPAAAPTKMSGKVLLAEDNQMNQQLIAIYLSRIGVDITTVDDGQEAMTAALAGDFDLILMDMHMPVMDGLQAAQGLREQGYDRPIVALTANSMREDKERCKKAGCNGFISKPIDTTEFYQTISRFLTSRQAEDENNEPIISSLIQEDPSLQGLVTEYINSLLPVLNRIERELKTRQWSTLRESLHEIKGTSGNLGLIPLFELVKRMEFQCIDENEEELHILFDKMMNVYERIVAGMESK